jgi:hypothetical protein
MPALAGPVYECSLWIPGHYNRAAWRRYKEAARGERGSSGTDQVEAQIRDLMRATRTARNRER